MQSTKKLLFILSIIVCASYQIFANVVVMQEDFNTSKVKLKQKGWELPVSAKFIPNKEGGNSLKIIALKKRSYATFFIPVQEGKVYSGKVKIKYFNVKGKRGAVLFLEFADKDKKHVSGGAFPMGGKGTLEKWGEHCVKQTVRIPARVKFIKVYIGVEGTGTAIFDDLAIMEVVDFIQQQKPVDNGLLTTNQPRFSWRPKLTGAVLQLSQDPAFSKDKTFFLFDGKGRGCIQPDFSLAAGKWYWKVKMSYPALKAKKTFSFRVPSGIPARSVRITPLWENKFSSLQPLLKVQIYPELNTDKVKVAVDGVSSKILSCNNNVITFKPNQKLKKGVYDINIIVDKQKHNFIYSTIESANKISFRKDKIMLLNGKPFFPIGAYRDPSDSISDFSGVKEAGFNMTHSYLFEEQKGNLKKALQYLENAQKNNIKVFMGINRENLKNLETNEIQKYCASIKAQKSLLSWYLFDEPIYNKLPPICLERGYQAIKSVDKDHPVGLLFCRMPSSDAEKQLLNEALDVLWTDRYRIKNNNFNTHEYNNFLLESKENAGEKPFWSVIQGSDLNVWPNGASKTAKYPTPLQTRLLAHMSLAAGAAGLIWYWAPKRAYHIKKDAPAVWQGICETVKEINELTPYLVGEREKYPIKLPKQVKYWSAAANGKRVLTLVNTADNESEFKTSFNVKSGVLIKDFYSQKIVEQKENMVNVRLNRYEVKIYYWREY